MADATVSKTVGRQRPCGFDSHLRHHGLHHRLVSRDAIFGRSIPSGRRSWRSPQFVRGQSTLSPGGGAGEVEMLFLHTHRRVPTRRSLTSLGIAAAAAALIAVTLAAARDARAALGYAEIASAGPLLRIDAGNELSCQASVLGDEGNAFFPNGTAPADCGTFLATGGALYAPDFFSHDGTTTIALGSYTPFTAVSQSGVLGTGTALDPFRVVTVADAGATGLRITQTDSYIAGNDWYQTDVAVTNTTT